MDLERAPAISHSVMERLCPLCTKIEVAGFFGWSRLFVNDIDIVLISGALSSLGQKIRSFLANHLLSMAPPPPTQNNLPFSPSRAPLRSIRADPTGILPPICRLRPPDFDPGASKTERCSKCQEETMFHAN